MAQRRQQGAAAPPGGSAQEAGAATDGSSRFVRSCCGRSLAASTPRALTRGALAATQRPEPCSRRGRWLQEMPLACAVREICAESRTTAWQSRSCCPHHAMQARRAKQTHLQIMQQLSQSPGNLQPPGSPLSFPYDCAAVTLRAAAGGSQEELSCLSEGILRVLPRENAACRRMPSQGQPESSVHTRHCCLGRPAAKGAHQHAAARVKCV